MYTPKYVSPFPQIPDSSSTDQQTSTKFPKTQRKLSPVSPCKAKKESFTQGRVKTSIPKTAHGKVGGYQSKMGISMAIVTSCSSMAGIPDM